MTIFDNFIETTPLGSGNQKPNWRESLQPVSFRNKKFYVYSSNTSGDARRIVTHEYPQQDIPYHEDMGQQFRVYELSGYVIGDNWEKERDELRKECAKKGAGLLIHPDFGQVNVRCIACNITEDKTTRGKSVDFNLVFVEDLKSPNKQIYIDSAQNLRTVAKKALSTLDKVFNTFYTITNLPNYVYSFISNQVSELIGIAPLQVLNVVDSFYSLKSVDFSLPLDLSQAISKYTASINNDYINDEIATYTIDPQTAIDEYLKIANTDAEHVNEKTPTDVKQNIQTKIVENYLKQNAIIQACIASTYINFKSYDEAIQIWDKINVKLDALIEIAGNGASDGSYKVLKDVKASFVEDIKTRAPDLTHVIYKNVRTATPALVIAYEHYDDISREQEIIDRNKIIHPGFIMADRLELLSE
jgi:prophage DNA circulation protein